MRYRLYCFDMDGVLYDSRTMVGLGYQRALQQYNAETGQQIPVPDVDTIMEEIGKPIPVIYRNLFPQLSEAEQRHVASFTLAHFVELIHEGRGVLLPGAAEVLSHLHRQQVLLGLASNGRVPYLQAILDTYDLRKYFHSIVFVDGKHLPSKGSLIKHYMHEFDVPAQDTLMIGDRMSDYDAAQEAGVDFACIMSGHGNDFSDEPITYRLHHLQEVLEIQ